MACAWYSVTVSTDDIITHSDSASIVNVNSGVRVDVI